jgi:hypothetical protein
MQLNANLGSKYLNCAKKKLKDQIENFRKITAPIHNDL